MRALSILTVAMVAAQAVPARAADRLPATAAKTIQQSIAMVGLVEAFIRAQRDFDQARLRALTADSYVEISPLGEVDPRDKMLSFYDPAKKVEAPAMTLGDRTVRMVGRDAMVMVTSISYSLSTKDAPRTVSLRAVFIAQRERGTWRLVSAQYTSIRPKN